MLSVTRAVLAVAIVSMGCGPSPVGQGASPAAAARQTGVSHAPIEEPVLRLSRPAPPPPIDVASGRNPFRFAEKHAETNGVAATRKLPPLPPPDGLPELPLPIVRPPLRLLGVVTTADGQRVAVIAIGSDLTLVRKGERFGGRFSVTSISDEAVEVSDAVANQPVRLALP